MAPINLLEFFYFSLSKKEKKYLEEQATDYLLFLGNHQPTKEQKHVIKSLLSGVFIRHSFLLEKKLSFRELQCLLLAAQGKTIKQTAIILDRDEDSVKYYRRRLTKIFGCKNMSEVIFVAFH